MIQATWWRILGGVLMALLFSTPVLRADETSAWLETDLPPLIEPDAEPPFTITSVAINRNHVDQEILRAEYARERVIRTLADEVKLVILPVRGGRYAVYASNGITISPRSSGVFAGILDYLLNYKGDIPGGARMYLEMRAAGIGGKKPAQRISKVFWYGTKDELAVAMKAKPVDVDLKTETSPETTDIPADTTLPAGTPLRFRAGQRWIPATLWAADDSKAPASVQVFLAKPGGLYRPYLVGAPRSELQIEAEALAALKDKKEDFRKRDIAYKTRLSGRDTPTALEPVGDRELKVDDRVLGFGIHGLMGYVVIEAPAAGKVKVRDIRFKQESSLDPQNLFVDPSPEVEKPATPAPVAPAPKK